MDRVLRNVGASLSITNYDASGNPANAGGGNGTADVKDSAGTAISGSPLTAVNSATGVYTITLPTALNVLDVYDVTWNLPDTSKRYTQFEMVGRFLFTQADFRAFHTGLASETNFSDAKIIAVRGEVEDLFESAPLRLPAFRPRGRREFLDGDGTDSLLVNEIEVRTLVSAKIDGTALTSGELADVKVYPYGKLVRDALGSWATGVRNVEVLYEHGMVATPGEVKRAAMTWARFLITAKPLDDMARATGLATGEGFYRLTLAGRDGPTGIPDIDAVLMRYQRPAIL